MKTIAKAALGTFALLLVAAATPAVAAALLLVAAATPAVAAHATVAISSPAMREPPPCLRMPAYRPAFCFRRDTRWRSAFWRHLSRAQQMAFVQHRYWGLNRGSLQP